MDGGWKDTRIGELARAIHERMNVEGLALAIGKDESRAHGAPARMTFSAPEGEDLEPPIQQGGEGRHVCEDRVCNTVVTLWGLTPSATEQLYERMIVALRELGIARGARKFGRVRWEEGGGRAGSAGVKVIVPLALRLPIMSMDLRKALVLTTQTEVLPVGEEA